MTSDDRLERDTRFVDAVRRSQRPFMAIGIVLALLGSAYLTWAIVRYKPHLDPRDNPGFDRPVAQLAYVFQNHQDRLEKMKAETPTERRLIYGLTLNMQWSAGIMVLLLRIFIGTLVLVFGLAIMTVVVERARLLAVLGRRPPA
jgi:hypothetical protein